MVVCENFLKSCFWLNSGADPGLPLGGASPSEGDANIQFSKISKNLHEMEKFLGRGGHDEVHHKAANET